MGSFIFLLLVVPFSVLSVTDDCNFVIDCFWTTLTPPTPSPTPAPTNHPTAPPTASPTTSPTDSPTGPGSSNTTAVTSVVMLTTTEDDGWLIANGGDDPLYNCDPIWLRPRTFNHCYSFKTYDEYMGDFSVKYECDSNDWLVRTVYHNSLICDSINYDTTTIKTWEQGVTTKYLCNQANACDFARITNASVTSTSPTDAPTDAPTPTPTNAPTQPPTDSPTNSGNMSSTANVVFLYSTTEDINDISIGGGDDDGNWWDNCDNDGIIGPSSDTSTQDVSLYGINMCISIWDFDVYQFDDYDYTAEASFGWYCDSSAGQYFMALFQDQECTQLDEILIEIRDDKCFGSRDTDDVYWTYVDCNVDGEIPTTSNQNSPSIALTPAPGAIETPSPTIEFANGAGKNYFHFILLVLSIFLMFV